MKSTQPLPGCEQTLPQSEISEALEMIGESLVFLEYVISRMFQHLAVPYTGSVPFQKVGVLQVTETKTNLSNGKASEAVRKY